MQEGYQTSLSALADGIARTDRTIEHFHDVLVKLQGMRGIDAESFANRGVLSGSDVFDRSAREFAVAVPQGITDLLTSFSGTNIALSDFRDTLKSALDLYSAAEQNVAGTFNATNKRMDGGA